MKAGKIIKLSLVSLLFLGLVAYIVYSVTCLSGPNPEEICTAVKLEFTNGKQSEFIDKNEVEAMLKAAHVYPTGMLMKDVDTKKIEETIRANDFVAHVECYKTSNGKLCVKVEQRVPVIYVIPEGRSGYFVDAQGYIIPNTNYASNIVTATGKIDDEFAKTSLSEFGQFLQGDDFWNSQIEQLYVYKNRKGEPLVEIVPRVGEHIITLGSLDNYEKKLNRLKVFYDNAINTVGWDKYAKISLEYDNQIICTKK